MEPIKPKKEGLSLECGTLEKADGKGLLHVSVVPPVAGPRNPCTFVCMIDVSGSMDDPSSTEKGGEMDRFSILDLVKHAVKTLAHMLGPDDNLSIVTFSTTAQEYMKLTKMDEAGIAKADGLIDAIKSDGWTNIWDALKVSIDVAISNPVCENTNTSLWLFTDGEPNKNPEEGIMAALHKYMEEKKPKCTLYTFGFGYKLDSQLLYDIAEAGNGVMCYLPDANLVGTTFVNCLCTALSTASFRNTLDIKGEGISNLRCIGYPFVGNQLKIGTVQYAQSRDFVFEFDLPETKDFTFTVTLQEGKKNSSSKIEGFKAADPIAIYRSYYRSTFNDVVMKNLKDRVAGKGSNDFLKMLADLGSSLPCKDDEYTKSLMRDLVSPLELEGRVSKAFSTEERIQRWGAHYIRSLVRAHQVQQCHNHKDPGVQIYGGKMFREFQQKADMTFCSLPPPTASIKGTVYHPPAPAPVSVSSAPAGSSSAPPAPAPSVMEEYVGGGGGCFDGEGMVELFNGSTKKVKEIAKGDLLLTPEGSSAKVLCVVSFPIRKEIDLVTMNGVKITPKHPVRDQGVWKYPKDLKKAEKEYCECIYNFVLDASHEVTINGVNLVTLGHEKHDNSIVEHFYYGSEKVVEDLMKASGWEKGRVTVEKCRKFKDPFTGKVTRISINQ